LAVPAGFFISTAPGAAGPVIVTNPARHLISSLCAGHAAEALKRRSIMSDSRKSPKEEKPKADSKRPQTLLRYCHLTLWGFDRKKS
jgi:hypothetical protein